MRSSFVRSGNWMSRWCGLLGIVLGTAWIGETSGADPANFVWPKRTWETRTPEELGLDGEKLKLLGEMLGSRGCVIKDGYVVHQWGEQGLVSDWFSSAKPVLSTLLLFAIHEGKVASAETKLTDLGWPLLQKDREMTLFQLAHMTSGYARPEKPGEAFAYNDFAIQLYQKTLFEKIFQSDANRVANSAQRLGKLGLEDGLKFNGKGRLAASTRDFARVCWFWLNQGAWAGEQVLPRALFEMAQQPGVPSDLPLSDKGIDTDDYLGIESYGGGSNHFTKAGPGIYGFNWWFNQKKGETGAFTWPDAPADAFMSLGARGNCAVMIPSLGVVAVAGDANWGEVEPGNKNSAMNQRLKLLADASNGGKKISEFAQPRPEVMGELKKWHRVSLTWEGPEASERGTPNPFRDYRLTVDFVKEGRVVSVPGFFAADGNAGETGAEGGNKWRVYFAPDQVGGWSYNATLERGTDVAISESRSDGEVVFRSEGRLEVGGTDKPAHDLRAKGRLRDVGGRYFEFAEKNEVYLKNGVDSPENLLAYADFDNTKPTHKYEPHAGDWREGDPTWKGGKGKALIGALNYLRTKNINGIYFLPMNVKGDGKDVWPWVEETTFDRYDVSKLDQWEIAFSYMDQLGIMQQHVTQEQENDQLLDKGDLKELRRLYYRELIARFAHHPAVVWNLGEENTNTPDQLKDFAKYFKAVDPYDNPVVVHTFPSQYDKVYGPLLGDKNISGVSLQVGQPINCGKVTATWLRKSAAVGRPWAAFLDEIGPADTGVKPDADDPEHNEPRIHSLWIPLLEGGSGAEWLFGYKYAHNDINLEDFRSRDRMWDQTRWAIDFFNAYLPVKKMSAQHELVSPRTAKCFAQKGEAYLVFLPAGGEALLRVSEGKYQVRWYNPRTGGELIEGEVKELNGAGQFSLGMPPGDAERDWVVLVRKR